MWRSFFAAVLLVLPGLAHAQGTAYDALKTIGTQLSPAYVNRVISISGADGDPQPLVWRVVVADRTAPGGVREIVVKNGRIVANASAPAGVGPVGGATIKTSRLNLDSSGAFLVANYTADKSHTNFALVNYTLRVNERGNPVWIVTLQDTRRAPVGTIYISANKGNVTRVEGLYRGANMAHVEQDSVAPVDRRGVRRERAEDQYADNGAIDDETVDTIDEGDGDENIVKREIKRMFRRTKRDAEEMFGRVRSSFDEFYQRRIAP